MKATRTKEFKKTTDSAFESEIHATSRWNKENWDSGVELLRLVKNRIPSREPIQRYEAVATGFRLFCAKLNFIRRHINDKLAVNSCS